MTDLRTSTHGQRRVTAPRRAAASGRALVSRRAAAAGFTLLEVMVSLAILAISLVAILQLHSGGVSMHNHAKHLTVATLLARSKMVDIEEHLTEEGLSEFDDSLEGTFEEEGYPNFTWQAEIVKPDLDIDSTQIMEMIGPGLGLGGGEEDASSSSGPQPAGGLAGALGPMAGAAQGMIQTQVQTLLTTLEESVREVRITVRWKDITGPSEFSVVTHVVRMGQAGGPTPVIPGLTQ